MKFNLAPIAASWFAPRGTTTKAAARNRTMEFDKCEPGESLLHRARPFNKKRHFPEGSGRPAACGLRGSTSGSPSDYATAWNSRLSTSASERETGDAAGPHVADVGLGAGVSVLEGAFLLGLAPEDLVV